MDVKAFAAFSKDTPLREHTIKRRAIGAHDVQIEILFTGVCHTDLHAAKDAFVIPIVYPLVPGHEIVGRVSGVGVAASARFSPGDMVGVGCLVDSCGSCNSCVHEQQNLCPHQVLTFGSADAHLPGQPTYGGYSTSIVVSDKFVLRIPENLDLARVAPLLCAGITVYSPLKRWNIGSKHRVAVLGLGGLGHMAVKFARAFGAHVTVLTGSPHKVEDAYHLGAHDVVLTSDAKAMSDKEHSFDFVLDTVSAKHDVEALLKLLAPNGHLSLVGAVVEPMSIRSFSLIAGNKSISGSACGGIAETQEMLDFCGQQGIVADVEEIPIHKINEAFQRLEKQDVKYRFVVNIASLK